MIWSFFHLKKKKKKKRVRKFLCTLGSTAYWTSLVSRAWPAAALSPRSSLATTTRACARACVRSRDPELDKRRTLALRLGQKGGDGGKLVDLFKETYEIHRACNKWRLSCLGKRLDTATRSFPWALDSGLIVSDWIAFWSRPVPRPECHWCCSSSMGWWPFAFSFFFLFCSSSASTFYKRSVSNHGKFTQSMPPPVSPVQSHVVQCHMYTVHSTFLFTNFVWF